MNNRSNARATAYVNQENPILTCANVGDDRFISFIKLQASKPSGANLVVKELEAQRARGYRLDSVLSQLLAMAKATIKKNPRLSSVFSN